VNDAMKLTKGKKLIYYVAILSGNTIVHCIVSQFLLLTLINIFCKQN